MERNNPVGRWCTNAGLRKLTEATPMALPDMLMIGDPDIPGSKNASGVKASQPPLRTTRPSRQWPSSDSTRASPSAALWSRCMGASATASGCAEACEPRGGIYPLAADQCCGRRIPRGSRGEEFFGDHPPALSLSCSTALGNLGQAHCDHTLGVKPDVQHIDPKLPVGVHRTVRSGLES